MIVQKVFHQSELTGIQDIWQKQEGKKEDLKLIDIVIELLDARIPIASRNPDIEEITKGKKK